jgi:hypothetical protein
MVVDKFHVYGIVDCRVLKVDVELVGARNRRNEVWVLEGFPDVVEDDVKVNDGSTQNCVVFNCTEYNG